MQLKIWDKDYLEKWMKSTMLLIGAYTTSIFLALLYRLVNGFISYMNIISLLSMN